MAKPSFKQDEPEAVIDQPRAPLPPIAESPIPVVEKQPDKDPINPDNPNDADYMDGIFIHNAGQSKGEKFALCILEKEDAYGNTHYCKNSLHSWSGTATDFKLQFDKA
tara:strand:- start:1012 stop:1335 length:324 start_codon:yes stop_codon:yes gene_type:complete